MNAPLNIIKGSDNVFRDLGFPAGEAQNLLLRADLMIKIEQLVTKSALVQNEAAEMLGITQPRLNDLLKGRIEKFSLDALVNMLARVGKEVKMTVRKSSVTKPSIPKKPEARRVLTAKRSAPAPKAKSSRTAKIPKVAISSAKRPPQAQRKAA